MKRLLAVVVLGSLVVVGCEQATSKAPVKSSAPTGTPGAPSKDTEAKDKMIKEAAEKAKAEAEKKATEPKADVKDKDGKDKKDK